MSVAAKWSCLCVCSLLFVLLLTYIGADLVDWRSKLLSVAIVAESGSRRQFAGSATSGKLFKMEVKTHSFADENYNQIKVESAEKKRLKFGRKCESDFWIVLTTIFNVSRAILDYNAVENWCTVIAADRKSVNKKLYDKYLRRDKVVYLDLNDQAEIFQILNHFELYDLIPFDHFGRKNLGFLYAMMNGAKYIYDTDDDNRIVAAYKKKKKGIPILGNAESGQFEMEIKEMREPRLEKQLTFNVFLLWSNEFIWPRGYDIAALTESFKWHKSVKLERKRDDEKEKGSKKNWNPFVIQQWLSNVEPDFDALARLIGKNIDWRKGKEFAMEYRFEIGANNNFAVAVNNNLYVPFNAQMTVWDYRSFLFLYLPITVHGRVSDIWRAYFAQTVLHILHLNGITNWRLLYCPVLVDQYRNVHNYLADFQAELPLYLQTHQLLIFLHDFAHKYKINGSDVDIYNVNIGQIALDLYISLYEYNIIKIDDVKGIYSWINDIVNKIGWNLTKW